MKKININWNTPQLKKEVAIGMKIEREHTKSKTMQKKIAKDHIKEFGNYYTDKKYGLLHMEKMLKKRK